MLKAPIVVGCLRVRNGIRYIERWVADVSKLCSVLCILDDGSTDGTLELLQKLAKGSISIFLQVQKHVDGQAGQNCRVLYEMALALGADWIFAPDADEFLDAEDVSEFSRLVNLPEGFDDIQAWTFPCFYLWNSEQTYRADGDYGHCHAIRLFRADASLRPTARNSHTQLCSDELDRSRIHTAPIRMIHYGYMSLKDRQDKFDWYTRRDADPMKAGAGVKNYDHIIEKNGAAVLFPYPTKAGWLLWR